MPTYKPTLAITPKQHRLNNAKLSMVEIIRSKLATIDPKYRRYVGDRVADKYIKLALAGDPIILRDLINRMDGLPKQTISHEGNAPDINVLNLLFGNSIRPNEPVLKLNESIDTTINQTEPSPTTAP